MRSKRLFYMTGRRSREVEGLIPALNNLNAGPSSPAAGVIVFIMRGVGGSGGSTRDDKMPRPEATGAALAALHHLFWPHVGVGSRDERRNMSAAPRQLSPKAAMDYSRIRTSIGTRKTQLIFCGVLPSFGPHPPPLRMPMGSSAIRFERQQLGTLPASWRYWAHTLYSLSWPLLVTISRMGIEISARSAAMRVAVSMVTMSPRIVAPLEVLFASRRKPLVAQYVAMPGHGRRRSLRAKDTLTLDMRCRATRSASPSRSPISPNSRRNRDQRRLTVSTRFKDAILPVALASHSDLRGPNPTAPPRSRYRRPMMERSRHDTRNQFRGRHGGSGHRTRSHSNVTQCPDC